LNHFVSHLVIIARLPTTLTAAFSRAEFTLLCFLIGQRLRVDFGCRRVFIILGPLAAINLIPFMLLTIGFNCLDVASSGLEKMLIKLISAGPTSTKSPLKSISSDLYSLLDMIRVTGEVLFAALVMDPSNQLVLHILLNAEKAWYREQLSIEAVST
jgi:hypothetical protein